jgi:hypothetical protein
LKRAGIFQTDLTYSTRKTDPSRCVPAGLIFFSFCASNSLIAVNSVISCTSRPYRQRQEIICELLHFFLAAFFAGNRVIGLDLNQIMRGNAVELVTLGTLPFALPAFWHSQVPSLHIRFNRRRTADPSDRFTEIQERYQTDITALWEIEGLIEARKKERNGDRKPYKEGRVVRVVAAVVILAAIVPTAPVAAAVLPVGVVALPSVGVVPLPPVGVVPLTPASVVPITPVIVAVVISVAAGMNGRMTGMDGTSLRGSNSDDGYQDKA